MATSTVYDVRVKYMLDDRASKGIAGIGRQAKKTSGLLSGLRGHFRSLAVGAAGYFGFRAAKKYLIDYNASLEQSRIQMAGLLQMNLGDDWSTNMRDANKLMTQFQEDAKKSTSTTKDFVDMASLLTGPLTRAGASVKDVRDVTKGAVIASKAFGIESEVAARDIEQAMAGTLGQKDRFARALLEPMGMTTKKWNEMVKKTPGKAAEMLKKAFAQPAVANMAKAQEKSWAGVTSTLEDNLQRAFGKIGLPLMQKISAEMQKLNLWFEKNPEKVNQIVQSIANGFVRAFEMAKSIFGFIVKHRDLLMKLATAYLVGRAAGGLAGMIGSTVNTIQGFGGALAGAIGKGGLVGFTAKLGVAGAALGGLYLAAKGVAKWVEARQEESISKKTRYGFLEETASLLAGPEAVRGVSKGARTKYERDVARSRGMLGGADVGYSMSLMNQARMAGFIDKQGRINEKAIKKQYGSVEKPSAHQLAMAKRFNMTDVGKGYDVMAGLQRAQELEKIGQNLQWLADTMGKQNASHLNNLQKMLVRNQQWHLAALNQTLVSTFAGLGKTLFGGGSFLRTLGGFFGFGGEPDTGDRKSDKKRKSSTTNVRIAKIEVVSDDPDRFAFNLVGAFQDYIKSPTQAINAIREG